MNKNSDKLYKILKCLFFTEKHIYLHFGSSSASTSKKGFTFTGGSFTTSTGPSLDK